MDLFDKWEIVELKVMCMRVLVYLMDDEVYTKGHAAKDMRRIVDFLDFMEQKY